jgi:uncharacterized coiled-coil DUF342 family protein
MDLIKFSSALKRKQKISQCVQALKEKLAEIPDLHQFRNTDELAEIVTCSVECLLSKKAKKYKIDKKAVVFDIYAELFQNQPLTPDERENLSKRIEFLHEKGLIHAVPIVRWVSRGVLNWLKKKIL